MNADNESMKLLRKFKGEFATQNECDEFFENLADPKTEEEMRSQLQTILRAEPVGSTTPPRSCRSAPQEVLPQRQEQPPMDTFLTEHPQWCNPYTNCPDSAEDYIQWELRLQEARLTAFEIWLTETKK